MLSHLPQIKYLSRLLTRRWGNRKMRASTLWRPHSFLCYTSQNRVDACTKAPLWREKRVAGEHRQTRTSSSSLRIHKHKRMMATARDEAVVNDDCYRALRGPEAWLVSEQSKVQITDLWNEQEKCVLFFARSMG